MISVGSRDGRKGLILRYGVGGGKMELETELEEGEACFQNNNDDDSTIDPDISLSYIDEKLQDVLGHCQKDFEGGVSAENLGAKFGGYGSFLPTYQCSPVWSHPKSPPKVLAYNAPISLSNAHVEGGHQNSVSQSSASQSARYGPASFSGGSVPASKGGSMDGNLKEAPTSSAKCGNKSTLNGQHVHNFANASDHKSLKVRIKVGSDNWSTRRNAEIYSGLGLDVSSSSSLEASPVDSDGFFHVPQYGPDESPTSILEIMTSSPVCGSLLLSPLPYDLLHLIEKEKWEDGSCGSVHKGSQESTVTLLHGSDSGKVDQNVLEEKKPKSSQKNSVSMESINGNDVCNGIGVLATKETGMDNLACEELVSSSRLRLPSNTQCNTVDFGNVAGFNHEPNDESSDIAKEEPLVPVFTRDDWQVEKPNRNDDSVGKILEGNMNSDEKNSIFSTKADSDVSKGSKTLDTGLVKPPKQKGAQKATSREKDSMKLAPGEETSSSRGEKKSKGSHVLENGSQNVDVWKGGLKHDSFSTSKCGNNAYGPKSYVGDLKRNNGKARETYKDLFGELDLEQEDDDNIALQKPSGDRLKDAVVIEKGTLESNSSSKERLNGNRGQKPSSSVYARVGSHIVPTSGNGPFSDTAAATVPPLVNEDWVCCDNCEKWRLLPPGLNPCSLPEKWVCIMLDWLPGMNRCSISEEDTTKAVTSLFPAPIVQGSQTVHPVGPQLGVISADAPLPDQRHQNLGSQAPSAGVKKKHGSKGLPNETKQDRPLLSSNSTKKKLQTSYRSRSLNGVNQSPPINGVEFQDSGQSSSLIARKHRLKHKETNKLCENFMDEGNSTHLSKVRNKRENTQDYPGECKKVKIGGKHGTDEDWASDHGEAVLKASCSSSGGLPAGISRKDRRKHNDHPKDIKSAWKISVINLEDQSQISSNDGTFHMGKRDKRNVAKKRKANEFENTRTFGEEMNEIDHGKEKKLRALKSREEGNCESKDMGGADTRGINVKDEKLRSLDVKDSSKKDAVSVHASLAAASSSSKVSGSHKTEANNLEAKGSPVGSVSSSPLRILNPDKFTPSRRDIRGVNDCQDASSPKKCSNGDDDRGRYGSGIVKKDDPQIATQHQSVVVESQERDLAHLPSNKGKEEMVRYLEIETCHVVGGGVRTLGQGIEYCDGGETTSHGHNEERMNEKQSHASGSRPRKSGKGSSLRSKDKSQISRSAVDKVNTKTSEPLKEDVDIPPFEEKSKGVRNKSQGNPYVDSCKSENGYSSKKEFSGKLSSESAKIYGQSKHRYHDGSDVRIDAISSHEVKQNERGKSRSLPPSGGSQNETERLPQPISGSQKENAGNTLSLDAAGGNDVLKTPKQNKKAENQSADQTRNTRHPTPNRHKGRDHDAPSPLRKDTPSQAAANALKEATNLKHTADRVKYLQNSGSNLDNRALYIQASLKFLHAASLLESCYIESGKYADMIQSMAIYSSTAKLCEYCAHEYEKTKEMATAALAYKCMEVAYLRVVYSSHASAWKDRHELQKPLQIDPSCESPSSSDSDLDNWNNHATADKAALVKGVNSPQVAGNHVIAAQNKPNFMRILNFAQEVNLAMEASRKSRTAFASFSSKEGAHSKEGILAVKTVLNFSFQDVEELLRLVQVAMEVINR